MKLFLSSILFFGMLVFSKTHSISQSENIREITVPNQESKYPDHTLWGFLLERHVNSNGDVDYQGLLKDRRILESYLRILAENQPAEQWTKNQKLAYYINLYNAYTVLLILDNYPTESIKKIKGPWSKKFIPLHGNEISLGYLEHDLLRKMGEPRIHFAINCASASCPKLLNKAYLPKELDKQLDLVTKEFINSERNQIVENQLRLSKIFKWYKNDFLDGDLVTFLRQYANISISGDADIDYLDYDWSLNGN